MGIRYVLFHFGQGYCCSEEAPIIFWGPHDSHGSFLAPEAVVSGPPGSGGGRSNQFTGVSRSPQPTVLSLSSSRDR